MPQAVNRMESEALTSISKLRDPASSMRWKTCAVVEPYNRHDEVYLTTVYLLERLGYEVRVFNTWRNRMKNSFIHALGVKPQITSRRDAKAVLAAAEAGTFDLVVFNTIEGPTVVDCAKRISSRTPILGFIHNGGFVDSKPEYEGLATHPRVHLMVLAPYIAERFARTAQAGFMYPVFFNDRAVPTIAPSPGKRRFCVQGYFDPGRRHYDVLLEAARTLAAEGRNDFEVWVMGRSFSQDFRAFRARVKQLGLSGYFRYTWKGVGYGTYYRLLNSVDFILPLISPDSHPVYFLSKSTSSIAAAVGFGKVPLVHRRLAELYGITEACLTYTDDMVEVMRAALDMPIQELDRHRTRIASTRTRFLEQSQEQLVQAIQKVSVRA
jgi:hypothetical protein